MVHQPCGRFAANAQVFGSALLGVGEVVVGPDGLVEGEGVVRLSGVDEAQEFAFDGACVAVGVGTELVPGREILEKGGYSMGWVRR